MHVNQYPYPAFIPVQGQVGWCDPHAEAFHHQDDSKGLSMQHCWIWQPGALTLHQQPKLKGRPETIAHSQTKECWWREGGFYLSPGQP